MHFTFGSLPDREFYRFPKTMAPTGSVDPISPAGPTGATGDQGPVAPTCPTGDQGPIAGIIPFSIGNEGAQVAADEEGTPEIIQFSGFGSGGYSYPIYLREDDWEAGIITIGDDPDYGTVPYGPSFIMPFDETVRNIYVTFGAKQGMFIEEGAIMYPFACLAVSNADDPGNQLVYTILQDNIVYSEPYIGAGDMIPKYTISRGALTGLSVDIPESMLVAIVIGWRGENVTSQQYGRFSVFGGIFVE